MCVGRVNLTIWNDTWNAAFEAEKTYTYQECCALCAADAQCLRFYVSTDGCYLFYTFNPYPPLLVADPAAATGYLTLPPSAPPPPPPGKGNCQPARQTKMLRGGGS